MIHVWDKRPDPNDPAMRAGLAREAQEQRCEDAYVDTMAPPCVACGEPVSDKDFRRHLYERHGRNEIVQPWGEPDAREALFLGKDAEDLLRSVARWRDRHPGVHLAPAAEGTRYGGKMVWVRFRVLDSRGKVAR